MSSDLMDSVNKFYQVFNDKDLSLWDEAIAETYVGHVNGRDIPNRDAGRSFVQALITAFPDLHYKVEDTVIEGNRVVTRWSATGTHSGPFVGLPPTERDVVKVGITIFRIEDGRVAELWNVWDQHGLMEQLRGDRREENRG